MALLKLPNELLSTILDLSRPYALEDLVLTCKHIYSIARPLLARHNELRRKYRHFSFSENGDYLPWSGGTDKPTRFVPQLLLDIAQDPLIALYIIHADLGVRSFTQEYSRDQDDDIRIALQQLDDKGNKNKLRKFIRESWFLEAIDADADQWLEHILEDVSGYDEPCDFGLVFLMSLLVNVESLILPGSWSSVNAEPRLDRQGGVEPYQYQVSQLMQLLVNLANDGTTREWPLKRLRKLHPTCGPDTQFGEEMISIAPFLSLESMREVNHASGTYLCCGGEPSWDTMYPAIGPNIESLELLDYAIDDEASKTFFRDMKKLKVFKMEYNMKDEIGTEWKAGNFVHNLMSAVGSQLESLSLKISWIYANEEPVTDLSGFTALQQLDLDVELFHRFEDFTDSEDLNSDDEERSILEMLPESLPSLRELRLECLPVKADVRCLGNLLRDFGSSKSLQLPNLVTAKVDLGTEGNSNDTLREVNDREGQIQRAQKICRETGNIEVTISENQDEGE